MQKEELIIIGAGISGLVLANELADKYSITILEAAAVPGGRIMSIKENGFPNVIEGGAEFIHGNLKNTITLLKEAGIKYVPLEGKMYRKKNNRWVEEDEMIEGWDMLLHKMKSLEEDMTLYDFLQTHFKEEKYTGLRKQVTGYAEGFDLADITKVSVRSLYKEWSHEEDTNYRIPAGYGALVNYLERKCTEKGCIILYNTTAKQIDWKANTVTVHTADKNKYDGQKIIVTVPVSVLQQSSKTASINFTPPLDEYTAAANNIGFGDLVKILILFKESFWKPDTGFIISEEAVPTWWTQLPDTTPLLTGWAGGHKAGALADKSEAEIIDIALLSLANIYGLPAEQLRNNVAASKIFNWPQNQFALGAYSYPVPQTAEAVKILNEPVDNTLFFCGEALYQDESPGTVEAAIISAKKVAEKLKA